MYCGRGLFIQPRLWLGKAFGVENRVAEPGSLEEALRPPHALFWGDSLSVIRSYASDVSAAVTPASQALRALIGRED